MANRGNPYMGRIECTIIILENTIKDVMVMKEKIAKEYVSILMESPLYMMLRLRERHSLLTRLLKMHSAKKRQGVIKERAD